MRFIIHPDGSIESPEGEYNAPEFVLDRMAEILLPAILRNQHLFIESEAKTA